MGSSLGLIHGLSLVDSLAPGFTQIQEFHEFMLFVLMFISMFVGGILISFWLGGFGSNSFSGSSLDFLEKKNLEIVWTLFPLMILMMIGVYSLNLLYELDYGSNYHKRGKNMKVVGRQWYWSYKYNIRKLWRKLKLILFYDSYMIQDGDLALGSFRKLEVDKPLIVKKWASYKIRTTSSDVIHSFSIPSFGLKLDSVPGRLKEVKFMCLHSGIFFGQCSELCGVNHSFMPMKIESLEMGKAYVWIKRRK